MGGGFLGLRVALAFRARAAATAADLVTDDPVVREAAERCAVPAAARAALLEGGADALLLAGPAAGVVAALQECARSHPGALLMDMAELKRPVLEAARRALREHPGLCFVGAHPLLPPEIRGAGSLGAQATPPEGAGELFAGVPVALCPVAEAPAAAIAAAEHAWRLLGALPVTLSAEEHDRWLALIEQLPAACALLAGALAARDIAPGTREEHLLGAGSLAGTAAARAVTDPETWLEALETNRDSVAPLARRLAADLRGLAEELEGLPAAGARAALEARLRPATAFRRRLGTA